MERKSIGSFIAALQRANGMTQKELATALGTLIAMHIEMTAIPPGDETEKGENDPKNV